MCHFCCYGIQLHRFFLRIEGFEPPRVFHRQNLNLICLPIPSYPRHREVFFFPPKVLHRRCSTEDADFQLKAGPDRIFGNEALNLRGSVQCIGLVGLEPTTLPLWAVCSNQLNYKPKMYKIGRAGSSVRYQLRTSGSRGLNTPTFCDLFTAPREGSKLRDFFEFLSPATLKGENKNLFSPDYSIRIRKELRMPS